MADQIRHNETRKPYCKPEIERVKLVPEEAVLGGCKTLAHGGGIGKEWGSCAAIEFPCQEIIGT